VIIWRVDFDNKKERRKMEVSTIIMVLYWVLGIILYVYFGYLYVQKISSQKKWKKERTKKLTETISRYNCTADEANEVAKYAYYVYIGQDIINWIIWIIPCTIFVLRHIDHLIFHPIVLFKHLFVREDK
jgi:hypothetical protein